MLVVSAFPSRSSASCLSFLKLLIFLYSTLLHFRFSAFAWLLWPLQPKPDDAPRARPGISLYDQAGHLWESLRGPAGSREDPIFVRRGLPSCLWGNRRLTSSLSSITAKEAPQPLICINLNTYTSIVHSFLPLCRSISKERPLMGKRWMRPYEWTALQLRGETVGLTFGNFPWSSAFFFDLGHLTGLAKGSTKELDRGIRVR